MVVAQAGIPVHLGVNTWATTVSMTWLFTHIIPGLGSLYGGPVALQQIDYTPIAPKGATMVLTALFPGG